MKIFKPTDEQRKVIEASPDCCLLVQAGPGSGKTQVAALRLLHLLKLGLTPAQILVLSFSRSAVQTLTKRITTLQEDDQVLLENLRHLVIRTFDSWAFRMLRIYGYEISDLLKNSYEKNITELTQALADEEHPQLANRIGIINHVIVDEFQDLTDERTTMVMRLLQRLNKSKKKIGFTILGDSAQAIFRFASHKEELLLKNDPWEKLRNQMGKNLNEVVLAKNHRATSQLASLSEPLRKTLLRQDLDPKNKLSESRKVIESLHYCDIQNKLSSEWMNSLPKGSTAILTRKNGEALNVAKQLFGIASQETSRTVRLKLAGQHKTIPAWIGVIFSNFKPKTIARSTFSRVYDHIVTPLDEATKITLQIPLENIAWQRLVHASGKPDIATEISLDDLRERLNWIDAFPDDDVIYENSDLYVTNIHQAKGMEFDNVILLDRDLKTEASEETDALEEANINFVALTRAAKSLTKLPASSIYTPPYLRGFRNGRSRYVSWGSWKALLNLEIGINGDIDSQSFVDTTVHESVQHILDVQEILTKNAAQLLGHKIILLSHFYNGDDGKNDIRYNIHLHNEQGNGQLLGRTSRQLTQDLRDLLADTELSLPSVILNLRIAEIITMTHQGDIKNTVPEPWNKNKLWLGITLKGTGDFKKKRRKNVRQTK